MYPDHYSFNLINHIEEFKSNVINHELELKQHSFTIEFPASHCMFCPEGAQVKTNNVWFEFKTPEWSKDAILYQFNKIVYIKL